MLIELKNTNERATLEDMPIGAVVFFGDEPNALFIKVTEKMYVDLQGNRYEAVKLSSAPNWRRCTIEKVVVKL